MNLMSKPMCDVRRQLFTQIVCKTHRVDIQFCVNAKLRCVICGCTYAYVCLDQLCNMHCKTSNESSNAGKNCVSPPPSLSLRT